MSFFLSQYLVVAECQLDTSPEKEAVVWSLDSCDITRLSPTMPAAMIIFRFIESKLVTWRREGSTSLCGCCGITQTPVEM